MSAKIAYLAIQCKAADGTTGTFLFVGESKARMPVSPVFPGCVELFAWTKANGWAQGPYDPAYPVGVYTRNA